MPVELSRNPQISHLMKMLLCHDFETFCRKHPAFAKAGHASPSKPGVPVHQAGHVVYHDSCINDCLSAGQGKTECKYFKITLQRRRISVALSD